ncbi:UNVERIFIED_CONTAM: hypothetical protein FKN15_041105 [Acipenser sinensis]
MFALIADETQDINRHEQVAVVLRYVGSESEVQESFIGFYRTTKTDSKSLMLLLKSTLSILDLDIDKLRAQCYDGAANMRGNYSGVASRILKDNPLAMYMHCYTHILNLCIVGVCSSVPAIQHMMSNVSSLHTFIEGSAKLHAIFEALQKGELYGQATTLKSLSDTRWSCCSEALKSLLNNFDLVVVDLAKMSENDV